MQETIISLLSGIMAVSNFYAILRKFKNDSPEQSSVNLKFLMDVSDIYTIRSRIGGNKSIYICKTKLKVAQVGLHPDKIKPNSFERKQKGKSRPKSNGFLFCSWYFLVFNLYTFQYNHKTNSHTNGGTFFKSNAFYCSSRADIFYPLNPSPWGFSSRGWG